MKLKHILFSTTFIAVGAVAITPFFAITNQTMDLNINTPIFQSNEKLSKSNAKALPTNPYKDVRPVVGENHGGAIVDGKLFMWGKNDKGQIGNGTYSPVVTTPVEITGWPKNQQVTDLVLGYDFTAILTAVDPTYEARYVYTWGNNNKGQLAPGYLKWTRTSYNTPQPIVWGNGQGVTMKIAAGYDSMGVIQRVNFGDSELYMWGANNFYQTGIPNPAPNPAGMTVRFPVHSSFKKVFSDFTMGDFHGGVIMDGDVYTWGKNDRGQLGLGRVNSFEQTPQKITTLPKNESKKLDFGGSHSGSLVGFSYIPEHIRALYMWGDNSHKQLGLSGTISAQPCVDAPSLVDVPDPWDNVTSAILSLGKNHSGVLPNKNTPKMFLWGDNRAKQVSITQPQTVAEPKIKQVFTREGTMSQYLALGGNSTVMTSTENIPWGWGENNHNNSQLGTGIVEYYQSTEAYKLRVAPDRIVTLNSSIDINGEARSKLVNEITENDLMKISKTDSAQFNDISSTINTKFTNFKRTVGYVDDSNRRAELTTDAVTRWEQGSGNIPPPDLKFKVLWRGFKPVKLTATYGPVTIAVRDKKLFEGREINELVLAANQNGSSLLPQYIKDNQKDLIGDVSGRASDFFPLHTKIIRTFDFKVIQANIGSLVEFKIEVDKHYKANGNDIIEATSPNTNLILTSKFQIVNFPTLTIPSSIEVQPTYDKTKTSVELLSDFGFINEQTIIPDNNFKILSQYVNFKNFPNAILGAPAFTIKNPIIEKNSLRIHLQVETNYFNAKGIFSTTPFLFPNQIILNNLPDVDSSAIKNQNYPIIPPDLVKKDLGYVDSTSPIIKSNLEKYITLKSFPNNTSFTLNNWVQTDTSVSFTLFARNWYDTNGTIQTTNKSFGSFEYLNLPKIKNTNIIIKPNYPTDGLTGDVINSFFSDPPHGNNNFNSIVLSKYLDFVDLVPNSKMILNVTKQGQQKIDFDITVSSVYVQHVIDNNPKTFSFSLTGFGTITDSDKLPFIKPIFQGTGEENQKEIEKVLTNTATFNSNDLTFQKWFDTGIYPPNTTFTILNSKKSHVSLLFTHFHIEVEANQYYAGNTTIHQPQVRTVEIKEQLIYTPTNIIVKPTHIFPQIETTEFSEYIDYNSSSNHFDILKLSKFLTFINVDSTETKLMNLKFSDNIATFDLVSNTWIDENGLGCYDPDPANSKTFSFSLKLLAPKPPIIPPITPTPPGSTTTPSVTNSSPLDTNTIIAIGVTTSTTSVVLILLLTLLLIKRYKRKVTNDFNMVLYDENFSGHPQTSRQRRYSKQRSKESNVKQG